MLNQVRHLSLHACKHLKNKGVCSYLELESRKGRVKFETPLDTVIWKHSQYKKTEQGMRLLPPSKLSISGQEFIKKQII